MTKSTTSTLISLLSLLALIVVTFNLIRAHDALEKSQARAREAKIGFAEAVVLYAEMGIYQLTAHPHPGAPLALEDFVKDDSDLCQSVETWNGVGCFYLLGHVPPAGQPCAVYLLGATSVPDLQEHPEWEISARIRDGSLQPR
jgi:hypothetical protein